MARKKSRGQDGPGLYELHEQRHTRRIRRQRALFIPRLVHEASVNDQLKGAAQDQAYQIALRWADLESDGQLQRLSERTIDTQFLQQLFVDGLDHKGTWKRSMYLVVGSSAAGCCPNVSSVGRVQERNQPLEKPHMVAGLALPYYQHSPSSPPEGTH